MIKVDIKNIHNAPEEWWVNFEKYVQKPERFFKLSEMGSYYDSCQLILNDFGATLDYIGPKVMHINFDTEENMQLFMKRFED
jgi:hypothetical protein